MRTRTVLVEDEQPARDRLRKLDWLFSSWMARSAKPTSEATQMLELLQRTGFVETQRG